MNIADVIFQNNGSNPAFIAPGGILANLTFDQARVIVELISDELKLDDFSPGDRIALVSSRGPSGLLAFLAISSFATCCPLDPRLLEDELAAALRDLGVAELIDGTDDGAVCGIASVLGLPVRRFNFSDLMKRPALFKAPLKGIAKEGDNALLLQTSGTTSKPKHVALTHANVLAAARAIGVSYGIGVADICINPMPHHHVHGLISAGISSLVAGASQFCAPSFSPAAFDRALTALKPTWFTGSPAFHLGLLDFYSSKKIKPSGQNLRFVRSSSAPFPASALADYEALFGAPILENYGMTETASTVCSNLLPPGIRKPGSVGISIGADIRVVDQAGTNCPVDQEGEVLLRGPSIIRRYASGEAGSDYFSEGWLRTGDVGRLDKDGCLFILGRTKELIKRGGHSVYPLEVDSALLSHPDVVEAITFSLEHPTLGEELVAIFVPRSGSFLEGDDIRRYLEGKLSSYKIPVSIQKTEAIPKSATGKTARRSMRDCFADLFKPESESPASPMEDMLVRIWREIVGGDLGVTDNVFLRGADPIRAQRFCDELSEATGRRLTVKSVLRHPTIRRQAAHLAASETIQDIRLTEAKVGTI